MRRKNKLPELLAPAGDLECLIAAVRGGADAVYIGGKMFSARAYAKNFDTDEIGRAVSYCHLHGVKLYVTMNVQVYDNELEDAVSFAKELYSAGVDALIIADFGLIRRIRRELPDFELHASTQMSVHNSAGADEAYKLGCTRVVLARELSGKNIKTVTEKCLAETEVFLHGALCVCHSGQCLFSSMIGGRSGNRGECAQPCRLPYNDGKYILSLNDLSLAKHIAELIESGTASLKIEGRMKTPEYVYTVTSIYRRLLDKGRNSDKREDRALAMAFSRSGFTDGYFVGDTFRPMTGIRTDEEKQQTKSLEKIELSYDKVEVKASAVMKLGQPSSMTLSYKNTEKNGKRSVTVYGEIPSEAINAPLNEIQVKQRLCKMGNTFLSLSENDIELELDSGVNLSPGNINALRRLAAERFEDFGRELPDSVPSEMRAEERCAKSAMSSALFFRSSVLKNCDTDGLDIVYVPLTDHIDCKEKANGVYIPPVIMEDETDEIKAMLNRAYANGARYALVGNISHICMAREAGLVPMGDFRLNVFNKSSRYALLDMGLDDITVSVELTPRQASDVGNRAVVYGRIPLMITERCFMKDNFGCERCGKCHMTDRKGVKFPMMREYRHRNIIFNSAVTYMGDRQSEIARLSRHFIFTDENERDVSAVLSSFKQGGRMPIDAVMRRMGKRKFD